MSEPTIQRIRQAILKHRGGWQNATDEQLRECWRILPDDVRKQYLEATANVDPAQPKSAGQALPGKAQGPA